VQVIVGMKVALRRLVHQFALAREGYTTVLVTGQTIQLIVAHACTGIVAHHVEVPPGAGHITPLTESVTTTLMGCRFATSGLAVTTGNVPAMNKVISELLIPTVFRVSFGQGLTSG